MKKAMEMVRLARATQLFRDLKDAEIADLLSRLNAVKKSYRKGETVMHAGLKADRLMVIASGCLHVYEHEENSRQVLVRTICQGSVLGLWILHVPEITHWPGSVVAATPCTLISLDMARARALIDAGDPDILGLALNASKLLSRELFATWRKMTVMNAPTSEARIRAYLALLNNETGRTGRITIPLDRERMAEYLGVSRVALSRSLGMMRDRGLLTWWKNSFQLKF